MRIIPEHKKINVYLQKIANYVKQNNELQWEKYAALGSKSIKLICYSKDFTPLIEKQLSYILKDISDKHDATIVFWNEKEVASFFNKIADDSDVHIKARMRLDQLILKKYINLEVVDNTYSKHNPIISINVDDGIVRAYDKIKNIYYYGVQNLQPEEFIKQGHIFVQMFNKIVKSANANLVHGAVVGLDNNGILFCARGQRGKSTLAVLSMLQGFEYVSDDYLVLEKEDDNLYSYPIYSIITLSPRMYNELYYDLKGKFVSNNARRDKYVIDIQAYHSAFRNKYPIKICMFPEIVQVEKPSIIPCKKGRAITQLIHSTISQTEDKHDIKTIKKLVNFVKDFDFYQINLCPDIKANVECLKSFCSEIQLK